jgi:O-antigen/teichoic acid export membrane protein
VLALVLWQLQETTRRALMSDLRFTDAVWGDAISYLGQALIAILLAQHGMLNLNRAFLVMAGTSAAATILQSFQIGLRALDLSELKQIARDFWVLGRWSLLANASGIVTNLGYNWTLVFRHGLDANAIFSAVVFGFKLANPVMSSMGGLITPAVARASTTSMPQASRQAIRYGLFGAALLLPYFVCLLIFAPQILTWLSHGDKPYYQYPHLLRLFVANYSAVYLSSVIYAWLGGLGHSRYNFYASLVNIVVTLVIGLPLTWFYGVGGLIVGGLCSAGISALAAMYFIYHLTHLPPGHQTAHSPGSL